MNFGIFLSDDTVLDYVFHFVVIHTSGESVTCSYPLIFVVCVELEETTFVERASLKVTEQVTTWGHNEDHVPSYL